MHTEQAAGASKPAQTNASGFGSVLASATADAQPRSAAAASAHVTTQSAARAASEHQAPAANTKQTKPATEPEITRSEPQKTATPAQPKPASTVSARSISHSTGTDTTDKTAKQQNALAALPQVAPPSAVGVPAWSSPAMAAPTTATDNATTDSNSNAAGSAIAADTSQDAPAQQPAKAQGHHANATATDALQTLFAFSDDQQSDVSAEVTAENGNAPESPVPASAQSSATAQQSAAGSQTAQAALSPAAPIAASVSASTIQPSAKGTASGQAGSSAAKPDAAATAGAGKSSSSSSADTVSNSSNSSATSSTNTSPAAAHGQTNSSTVAAASGKAADPAPAITATVHAAPRDAAQTGASADRTQSRPTADVHSGDALSQVDNTAATSAINTSKLIQNMSETEMRVGLRSAEFGDISIRTMVSQQQMQAQISVDHSDLGHAIAAHLPLVQAKLVNDYGLHASIEVSQSGMSFSGERGNTPQRERQSGSASLRNDISAVTNEPEPIVARAAAVAGDGYRLSIQA